MNSATQDPGPSISYPLKLRPLPQRIRFFPDETTRSFLRRLEKANAVQPGLLKRILHQTHQPWFETIAIWCEKPPETVAYAMPQLALQENHLIPAQNFAGRKAHRTRALACHRCTLAHQAGQFVEIYTTHDKTICPEHKLWISDGTTNPHDQLTISACPEILAAWHHHKNIIQRQGNTRTHKAYEASKMINWQWYDQFRHFTYTTNFVHTLTKNQTHPANPQAIISAALYPAIVELTAILASPYWMKIAHSKQPQEFLDRISTNITEGWKLTATTGPLQHWIEHS